MSEQYKEVESQPEETMVEPALLQGIAGEIRALVLDEGFEEDRAFAEVFRRRRLHFGRTEDQMSELKEAVTSQLLAESIAKHANRGGRVHNVVEPVPAPVIVAPRVTRPVVARSRRSSTPPVFKRDEGPDSHERQLPPSDR